MDRPGERCHRIDADLGRPESVWGRPILDLGAALWESDRYEAFRVCYDAMRRVDDLVDARRSLPLPISPQERDTIAREVERQMLDSIDAHDEGLQRLHAVRSRFQIPRWPWERWTRSMIYDLHHEGFTSFIDYLRYSEGAAVAPGAIFVHLCGLRQVGDDYQPPEFDIRWAARPLALFCYLVHVVRDFEADQRHNLHCFPTRLLSRHGLVRADLRNIAEGAPIPEGFRRVLAIYHRMASWYAGKARSRISAIEPALAPRYRLSLELVFTLYQQIHEKMCPNGQRFRTRDLTPSGEEMCERIEAVLASGVARGLGS